MEMETPEMKEIRRIIGEHTNVQRWVFNEPEQMIQLFFIKGPELTLNTDSEQFMANLISSLEWHDRQYK